MVVFITVRVKRRVGGSSGNPGMLHRPCEAHALSGDAMPSWTLVCLECKADFKTWKIDDLKLSDYLFPVKPSFPVDGIVTRCPKCGHDGVYQSTELRYRALGRHLWGTVLVDERSHRITYAYAGRIRWMNPSRIPTELMLVSCLQDGEKSLREIFGFCRLN